MSKKRRAFGFLQDEQLAVGQNPSSTLVNTKRILKSSRNKVVIIPKKAFGFDPQLIGLGLPSTLIHLASFGPALIRHGQE